MPGNRRLRWRIVISSYPCPICDAGPGRGCRTERNRPKTEPHADRARLAHNRGWAAADEPARCVTCNGPLPERLQESWPAKCLRCRRLEPPPNGLTTKEFPGPDGSYDVPLWEDG